MKGIHFHLQESIWSASKFNNWIFKKNVSMNVYTVIFVIMLLWCHDVQTRLSSIKKLHVDFFPTKEIFININQQAIEISCLDEVWWFQLNPLRCAFVKCIWIALRHTQISGSLKVKGNKHTYMYLLGKQDLFIFTESKFSFLLCSWKFMSTHIFISIFISAQ